MAFALPFGMVFSHSLTIFAVKTFDDLKGEGEIPSEK
jgi:hypothetical protein